MPTEKDQAEIDADGLLNFPVQLLRSALAEALRNRHHENCDTRDPMIQGKPCNCYLLLESQLATAKGEIERLKAEKGDLIADLMGCRDGALVRDLRAELADVNAVRMKKENMLNTVLSDRESLRAELAALKRRWGDENI